MTPERWQQVQAVFAAAVERSLDSRGAYLSQVCVDDMELRREVESLLAAHDSASSRFLESPAGLAETAIQTTPPRGSRRLSQGTRLGTYEILASIGAGGMGEVYRARDRKLQREVAIKVLPESFAYDPDALARFEREAVAVAALSHPNILSIYDFGKQGDIAYAVMELLEGHTLREKLKAGPLPLNLVLHYTLQIVQGLAAAHEKGIVHRDLKPENLFITRDGRVKILDFGLAKRVERVAAGEETSAPTVEGHTTPGMVMGTLGYMSPEQLLGEEVDHRTDLFSFGVVLYEMVAHKAPFRGSSAMAIADAILHKQPPELTDKTVPAALKAILRDLLEKEEEKRYATAADALTDLKALEASLAPGRFRLSKTARVAIAAGLLLLITGGAWLYRRASRERWALETAAPEIARLIEKSDLSAAASLAKQARAILPKDANLEKLWLQATGDVSIESDPSAAMVAIRPYGSDPNAWESLGTTPLKSRAAGGFFVFRVTHPGSAPMLFVDQPDVERTLALPADSIVPPEMVPVAAGGAILGWPLKVPASPGLPIDDFLIDRHETTNVEFKRFVDAGGYERPDYWKQPFVRDGRAVPWGEAVASFRDSTSRPGPATWIAGTYPSGQADHPVSGVSWYEAAAFAEFAGKSLPTIYHWNLAAQTSCAAAIVPGSNFRRVGTQPIEQPGTLSGYGTHDMAGNVKEWCWNETTAGNRCILGGGFGDATYMFNQTDARSPWHREPNFGFRLAKLHSPPSAEAAARKDLPLRDFSKEKPPSDEIYGALKGLYSYDATDLRARVESTRTADDWTLETVSLDAAYGEERLLVHVVLPRRARPPFQTIVSAPGASALLQDQWDPSGLEEDFLVQTGRAVIVPVYKGMWERRDGLMPGGPGANSPASWRDHVIAMSKDLRRVVDYLQTRTDIDSSKLGYFGFSNGGALAPILLATEERIKAAILHSPGFWMQRALPEAEPFTFISRVRIPVLVLNERYDANYSPEVAQLPFFQALGTPAKDKRRVVAESGHGGFPRQELIRESLDFLDKYLGPVKR